MKTTKKTLKNTVKTIKTDNAPVQETAVDVNEVVKKPKRKWKKWGVILIALGACSYFIFGGGESGKSESKYTTVPLMYGKLMQVVTATGEISPVNTINVGSQVSGIIEEIFVDYNSVVKEGEILLTIDPSVLQASVNEAKASLLSAESSRNFAKNEYDRNQTLFDEGFIARAELEQSLTVYEQAEQSVKRSESQYERALTNLGYATILSPVDGTVISRKVDVGQTVAASFSAPDLFEIAEDLSKMQIETSVSEADIGMIKENQKVEFTVDAYPTETFIGQVKQIRLSPTTTSNVVVYTVVIDVNNDDLKLMPGMTAFVNITIQERVDVWKANNSAFLLKSFQGLTDTPNNETVETHIAIERNGQILLIPYEKGISTATQTEIISDELQKEDKIIIGLLGQESSTEVRMPTGGNRPR